MNTASQNRRQRAVMATDSEWTAIKNHARKAKMDVSRYIIEYARPASHKPDLATALDRTGRKVAVLCEIARVRLESNGMKETWDKCVAKATKDFDRERDNEND